MPSWHLADAATLAARHHYSFYQSPPEAIARASLGAVLSLDDRFIRLLDAPAGSAYAFDHNTQQFMAVDE